MASLYKRANSLQTLLLRIVEGAVRNYSHHHPEHQLTNQIARSIAKRAVGTLCQHIADGKLAVKKPSDRDVAQPVGCSSLDEDSLSLSSSDGVATRVHGNPVPSLDTHRRKKGRVRLDAHPPRLSQKIGILAGQARKSGNIEALEAYITVLKILAKRKKQ